MHRLIGVVSLLNFALLGSLPAQQVIPPFARWDSPTSMVSAVPASGFLQDTLPRPRRDYRYEGLAFGGIVLGAAGGWVGWNVSAACPTVPGAQCDPDRFGNAVAAGIAGAAIGGGLGYLIGRLSSKPYPEQLPATAQVRPSLIPDSTRIRVGYQHWEGAAIGAGTGGLIGTMLVIAAGRGCSDCNTTGSDYLRAISLAAGLGGTFGFLVGLASPRYQ